jgi:hypothetical protein
MRIKHKKQCIKEIKKHQRIVKFFVKKFVNALLNQVKVHDKSKLQDPELKLFSLYTFRLKRSKYGSDEYKKYLEKLKPALEVHYANNRHHPECHKNGYRDMDLIDIIEMFFDWKSAAMRNKGNFKDGLKINKERFGLSDDIYKIFLNTNKRFNTLEREVIEMEQKKDTKKKEEEKKILIEDGTMSAFGFENKAEVTVKESDKK